MYLHYMHKIYVHTWIGTLLEMSRYVWCPFVISVPVGTFESTLKCSAPHTCWWLQNREETKICPFMYITYSAVKLRQSLISTTSNRYCSSELHIHDWTHIYVPCKPISYMKLHRCAITNWIWGKLQLDSTTSSPGCTLHEPSFCRKHHTKWPWLP